MLHNEGKLSSGMSINMSQLACLSLIFKYHSMPPIVVYLKCLYLVHRMNIKINHCTASPTQVRRMSRSVNLPWSKRAWRDLKDFNMNPNFTYFLWTISDTNILFLKNSCPFFVGYACRFWVRQAEVFPYSEVYGDGGFSKTTLFTSSCNWCA